MHRIRSENRTHHPDGQAENGRTGHAGPGRGRADVAALADRVHDLGGSILSGPAEENGFLRVVVRDPAGATFSVSELLRP